MHSTQGQIALMDRLRVHGEQYASQTKANFLSLVDVWTDLEVPEEQQGAELAEVMSTALSCWSEAVAGLKRRQQDVRDSIQQSLSSIMAIKQELGADNPGGDAELQRLQGNRSAHRTLRAWEVDVRSKAHYWEQAKKQRESDYEDLQGRIKLLRQLCGMEPQKPSLERPDLTRANMEFLKLELEKLATEKERREDVLRKLLSDLNDLCAELGEDVQAAVKEVNPSLVYLWDAEAARVLRDVYRLGSSYSSAACGLLDLSDTTISRLGSKLTIMRDLKASRGAHASEVLGVLNSLWDATDVPDQERAHFVRMMSGPLRLHATSLEKCQAEVRRLEDVKYQQMVDLVLAKGGELRALCAESHVEQPAGLQEALDDMSRAGRNPGAAAELLAKILQMLAEVQVLTSKRGSIIAAINEVEACRQEEVWLAAYEADDQRYKGRDANKRLQRAIRAGKLREKLPSLIEELRGLLAEWRDCEGEAFLFDGRDYEFEVLDGLAAAVEEAAAARAAKAQRAASNRRLSLAPPPSPGLSTAKHGSASKAAASTPLRRSFTAASGAGSSGSNVAAAIAGAARAGGGVPRPSSAAGAASPAAPRRAGGPSTPLPLRGVGHNSLRERHSISVMVGHREREAPTGPAALSRSGEVRLRPDSHSRTASTAASRRASIDNSPSPSAKSAAASLRRVSVEGSGRGFGNITSSSNNSPAAAANNDSNNSSSSFKTPPSSRRLSRDTSAAGAIPEARTTTPASGSCKRLSTSSKLHSIFSRGSVQHPVAMLASEGSGTADSAITTDQDA